jgi:hypothetical protein
VSCGWHRQPLQRLGTRPACLTATDLRRVHLEIRLDVREFDRLALRIFLEA